MYSDFITFFQTLPLQSLESGSFLPDSFREQIPMDSALNFFTELNNSVKILGAVITLALALLACFFGYKFARLFMSITGFLAGAIIGFTICSQLLNLNSVVTVFGTLLGGALLAALAYRIYVAGIFILCFMLAFVAAAALLPFTGDIQFFLSTLIGFIIGSLSIKFIRPVIILSSALVGGSTAAGLIATVCEFMGIHTFSNISAGAMTGIICILGIIVQFLTTNDPNQSKLRRKKRKE